MKLTLEKAYEMMTHTGGSLDLSYYNYTSLPDNLVIHGNFKISHTPIKSLPPGLVICGSLYIDNTDITSIPADLTVKGSIKISHTPITSLPNSLTVVNGYLDLTNTPITSLPNGLTVNGWMDLSNTQITSLPNDLIVGGRLNLSNTPITSLPDNFVVGRLLNLTNTLITSLPNDLVVGHELLFNDKNIKSNLRNGDYVPGKYLYADDMLTYIKYDRQIGKYTYYIGKIPGINVIFDGEYYAHCKTFKQGVRDIAFKHAKNRGSEQYSNLTLDSVLSMDDVIVMYRIITGACENSISDFVNGLTDKKDSYTIREIIDITDGRYNSHMIREFFTNNI